MTTIPNAIKYNKNPSQKVVEIPDEISGIVKCVNPKCITNNEKIVTKFKVISKREVQLKCHYCEKITDPEHMVII